MVCDMPDARLWNTLERCYIQLDLLVAQPHSFVCTICLVSTTTPSCVSALPSSFHGRPSSFYCSNCVICSGRRFLVDVLLLLLCQQLSSLGLLLQTD